MRRRFPAPALVLLLAAVLAACDGGREEPTPTSSPTLTSPGPTGAPTTPGPADLRLEDLSVELVRVADGFAQPVFVTNAGDGSGRLYVVEQAGRIASMDPNGSGRRPFLDIRERVGSGGERGLLGLAFHPDFPDDDRIFVNYTNRAGDTRISSFRATADRADASSERVLLRVDQPYANHNGGMVAFGPDGMLYVALGDGGSAGDPQNNAQDLDSLLGKILRIDVSGSDYRVPRDNPFRGRDGARAEIWHSGLRNPWRFSFDRETGAMFIGDVGQSGLEEIDVARDGGRNFGWRIMEGTRCHRGPGCGRDDLTGPVAEYPTRNGCAVTGGYVYRGRRHPELRGAYFFADYCGGQIWALSAARALEGPARMRRVLDTDSSITSFGEDQAGEVYVVAHGGAVFRLSSG